MTGASDAAQPGVHTHPGRQATIHGKVVAVLRQA
jgi:hypothetical protein